MEGVLNLKSENFLGGNNVHHLIIIGLGIGAIYLLAKKKA
jgi:hypothetical protein